MIAIVGSGLAALVAHTTLRAGGFAAEEIHVFGDTDDPAAAWRTRADAIRQTHMRSESDGHPFPRTFPGLAVREAWRAGDAWPLLLSLADRYRPTVATFLDAVARAREDGGWDESLRRGNRTSQVTECYKGFRVDGDGPYEHVLLALGQPGLAWPEQRDARFVHAYEPHRYAHKVAIVGAGMAAATEWRNARAAGADVVSIRRREPVLRPLNLPRPLFSKRGLAQFHRTDAATRVSVLTAWGAPSYPKQLDAPVAVAPVLPDETEQVICATGFLRGFRHDPLLARLVDDHDIEAAGRFIVLAPDATVPALTDDTRTLAVAGAHAQWAFPAADTIAGMRYVAHRFLRRCRTR